MSIVIFVRESISLFQFSLLPVYSPFFPRTESPLQRSAHCSAQRSLHRLASPDWLRLPPTDRCVRCATFGAPFGATFVAPFGVSWLAPSSRQPIVASDAQRSAHRSKQRSAYRSAHQNENHNTLSKTFLIHRYFEIGDEVLWSNSYTSPNFQKSADANGELSVNTYDGIPCQANYCFRQYTLSIIGFDGRRFRSMTRDSPPLSDSLYIGSRIYLCQLSFRPGSALCWEQRFFLLRHFVLFTNFRPAYKSLVVSHHARVINLIGRMPNAAVYSDAGAVCMS